MRTATAPRRRPAAFAIVTAGALVVALLPATAARATPQQTPSQTAPHASPHRSSRMPACSSLHVVAHRGDRSHVENTVEAFRSAVHDGADAIETDVRTTGDNKLVLMHDRTLGRTTTSRGRVHKMTGAEVHAARTNDGQRVPYVDAALRFLHDHRTINGVLELKSMTRKSMIRLRRKIIDFHVMPRVRVSSKREKTLRQAKRIMPHVRRKRLTWQPVRPRHTARYAQGVIIPLRRLDQPRVRRYRGAGLKITAMAATRHRSRKRMAKLGIDGLSSNNVSGFVEHCRTPLPEPERKDRPSRDSEGNVNKRPPPRSISPERKPEPPLLDPEAEASLRRLGLLWTALTLPQVLADDDR